MKVSAFTFGRNLVHIGYPVRECILSVLPIVDEFVVNIGDDDQQAIDLVRGIDNPKIRIVESRWNPNVRTGGYVLAQQTNIALFNCTGDWAIGLQSDELIHERDHDRLLELMTRYKDNDRVEGLLLDRMTFYEDPFTLVNVYPFQKDPVVRIVKPHRFVLSRGDAASFTVHPKYKEYGRPVRAIHSGVRLFHYGPMGVLARDRKKQASDQLWQFADRFEKPLDIFTRLPRQFVTRYEGEHPAVMQERLDNQEAPIDLDSPNWRQKLSLKEWRYRIRTWLICNVSSYFNRRRDHRIVRP